MPVKGYEKLLLYVAYCKLWGCSVTDRYDGFAQPVHLDSTAGTRPVLYFGYLYWIIKFSTKKYGRTFFWKRQFFSLSALKAQTSRPSWTLRTSFLPGACWLFWDHGEQTLTSICDTLGKAPTSLAWEVQTCRGSPRMTEQPCCRLLTVPRTTLQTFKKINRSHVLPRHVL